VPDKIGGVDEKSIAFELMFREHYVAVYRYVMRRVEESAVQDLVAETFLIAWRRQSEVSGDPLPWLLGVARRVCANHLRARGRRAALGERVAAQPQPSAGPRPEDRGLKQALASLSDRDREAVLLLGWDGLSNRQAAKVLGCSVATFAVRLHRARTRLAAALDSDRDRSADRPDTEGMATSDAR
jgi:RNA polymerase sigma-70 factor (ECF subfamily)